jgi:hypothetical protein
LAGKAGPDQLISLPKGVGVLKGIGEKFVLDLHTGTGNFTIPSAIPPGRNGLQPDLSPVYSTGNWNTRFSPVGRRYAGAAGHQSRRLPSLQSCAASGTHTKPLTCDLWHTPLRRSLAT